MANKNQFGGKRGQDQQAQAEPVVEQQAAPVAEAAPVVTEAPVPGPNYTLVYRREHPGARCSYGIAGNPGIVVFDEGLFAGFGQPGFQAPTSITLSCEMVQPKVDNKQAKAEAAAAKLAERAAKAQKKIEEAQAKAADKKRKADEALAAAQAKLAAATTAATPTA